MVSQKDTDADFSRHRSCNARKAKPCKSRVAEEADSYDPADTTTPDRTDIRSSRYLYIDQEVRAAGQVPITLQSQHEPGSIAGGSLQTAYLLSMKSALANLNNLGNNVTSQHDEIARYLQTGESDALHAVWPGESLIERGHHGNQALRNALVAEVKGHRPRAELLEQLANLDVGVFTDEKVAPMVRGFFPSVEQAVLMEMFSRSIVFLTPANISAVILNTPFSATAWKLANLYLLSCGVEPLSQAAPEIVGLSEATICYVSVAYFRFECLMDDFVVHEAAHIFHNCKRERVGLQKIQSCEWLLEIDYGKRELFAYACEAYSRILTLGSTPAERKALLAEIEANWMPPDDRVDHEEYIATLHEAVVARNGWKRVLERCRPPSRSRARSRKSIQA